MAKIPNFNKENQRLKDRLNKYTLLVQSIFDGICGDAASIACRTGYDNEEGKTFRFADYPVTKKAINELCESYVIDMGSLIMRGTANEWKQSNLVQDALASKILKAYDVDVNGKSTKYFGTNEDALKAFQLRKDKGMGLSDKLWNQSSELREELENAISTGLSKGTSAAALSKRLSKYLLDFDTLKADYSDKFGNAIHIKDCEYSAARLARNEINIAYRKAEQLRWEQMDFVVGYEIKTSTLRHRHSDVCDQLQGKYPKDFEWYGWHPNCTCFRVPLLKTEEEFFEDKYESEGFELDVKTNHEDNQKVIDIYNGLHDEYGGNLKKVVLKLQDNRCSVAGHYSSGVITIDNNSIEEKAVIVNGHRVVKNVAGENVVVYHEYGHVLTPFKPDYLEPKSYSEYAKNLDRSLSREQKQKLYDKYLESSRRGYKKLEQDGFLEKARELQAIFKEYKNEKSDNWISMYSRESQNEFFAEAFALVKTKGRGVNEYADRVVDVLDSYYKGKRLNKVYRNSVADVPDNLKTWLQVNESRLLAAEKNNTLPYFVKDNKVFLKTNKDEIKEVFVMTDSIKGELRLMGFDIRMSCDKYNSSAMRGYDILSTDRTIERIADRFELTLDKSFVKYGDVVGYEYSSKNDSPVFLLKRTFLERDNERIVIHNNIMLGKDIQRKGIAKELFRDAIPQYERIGISKIEFVSKQEGGNLCWADLGAYANNDEVHDIIENAYKTGNISNDDYKDASLTLRNYMQRHGKKMFPMNVLSQKKYGAKLLDGCVWNGIFDMKDEKQMFYLKTRIGLL